MRPRTLRLRLAVAFALAAIGSALFYAVSAITVFLLHEEAEASGAFAGVYVDEAAENLAVVLKIAGGMTLVAPVAAIVAGAIGWWLSGKALAPLREAAERAAAARAGAEELLLPVRGVDDEWDRLASVVNGLLQDERRAMERIRSFSASAAHELRTPLTALLGHVQVALRRERGAEEYRAVLTGVEEEATRLASLVDVLLTLARADSGELCARAGTFELGGVAADAAEIARRPLAGSGDLALDVAPAPARGDPLLTRRVLANLVENAFRHGAAPVTVRVWRAGTAAMASVTDAGPGLPAPVRARLFERFNREPGASEGFGLGLAIASALTTAQGGRLWLDDSAPGTRFVLELPGAGAAADPLSA